jgi:hypothetical protein
MTAVALAAPWLNYFDPKDAATFAEMRGGKAFRNEGELRCG